ncbi:MAG: CAP domain-containing protein [Lachnospiraceae bacterium]|nr:CAP domain-containing protein [Lachnospiraceae bacterium]
MKKKTLLAVIAGVVVLPLTICAIVIGVNAKKNGTIDAGSAFRASADIAADDVHYFDQEAIALADSSGDTASLRSEALRAYNLVNEERERAGLGTLVWDSNLEATSDVRARECEQSFSHTRPDGSAWYTVNSDIMGGENLAYGYGDAASVLDGWMNSPTHRENILYPTFTKISISVYVADDGTYYWAQEFGY